MNLKENRKWTTPEFWLVVIMLGILTLLVWLVLNVNIHTPNSTDLQAKDVLEYRKSILTIIITAFGAWVGAGAAYFFGRENMREAAQSLLKMHESIADKFKETKIRDLPHKPVDWTVKTTDPIDGVYKTINQRDRWYIPIVNDDGSLENVIHEDAIWRFIVDSQNVQKLDFAAVMKKTVADVVAFLQTKPEFKEFNHIYVTASPDDSASDVHAIMTRKNVFIGFLTDAKGKPTDCFTTADMRIFLLQSQ